MTVFSPAGPQVHPPGMIASAPGGAPSRASSPAASSATSAPRSAFRVAKDAAQAVPLPPRTVTLPASAWATSYPDRPLGDVEVGLRLYSEADAVQVRAAAAQRAWRDHPQESDEEERVLAGNGAVMALLVARAACKPDDARVPFFGHATMGGADDLVPLALTPKGIEFLFDHLNTLLLEESPSMPEADDEELGWLAEVLGGGEEQGDVWAGLDAIEQRRARKLIGAAIEMMRGGGG
jgi:hypothetical protein